MERVKRSAGLAFGVAAYAAFLGAFVYLIGFTADLVVPWSASRGGDASPGLVAAVGIDLGLIGLFGLQHTVMARRGFGDWLARRLDRRIHRSVFVLAASGALAVMYAGWQPLPAVVWQAEGMLGNALHLGQAAGWVLVLAATFMIDHFDLFGLRQTWAYFRGRSFRPERMDTPWLYRYVRHPLYLGFLIAFWSAPTMTAGRLVLAAGMSAYVLVGVRFEERDLLAQFGERYRAYREQVGMLLPRPRALRAPLRRRSHGST